MHTNFESDLRLFVLLYSFRRYFGIVISHYQVALYSARRDEMVETVQATLFYMNPDAPIPVHSTYAALPYKVRILQNYLVNVLVLFCSSTEDFPWYMN